MIERLKESDEIDEIWIMAQTNKKSSEMQDQRLQKMNEIDKNLTKGWRKMTKELKKMINFQWLDQQKCKLNERLKESDEINEFW